MKACMPAVLNWYNITATRIAMSNCNIRGVFMKVSRIPFFILLDRKCMAKPKKIRTNGFQ